MKVYTISGLGADLKAFEFLEISQMYELVELPWLIPEDNESIEEYARRMAEPIDNTEEFVLMGCSFGGIIAQEICRFLHPTKLILISTVKSEEELPFYMNFARITKAYNWLPYSFVTSDGFFSYTFFRRLADPRLPKLKRYFTHTNHRYLKWSIKNVVNWKSKDKLNVKMIRIHGEEDFVFPAKKVKEAQLISGGTHLMIIQKAKKISSIINSFLNQ